MKSWRIKGSFRARIWEERGRGGHIEQLHRSILVIKDDDTNISQIFQKSFITKSVQAIKKNSYTHFYQCFLAISVRQERWKGGGRWKQLRQEFLISFPSLTSSL